MIDRYASVARVLAISALLAGCSTLPSSGPVSSQILQAAKDPKLNPIGFSIVPFTPKTLDVLQNETPPLLSTLEKEGPGQGEHGAIGPGDVLAISVFEIGSSLFSGGGLTGGRAAASGAASIEALPPVEVDDQGYIPFPYIGRVFVAGETPTQLAKTIEDQLAAKSQNPQVIVRIMTDLHNSIIVSGDILHPGRQMLTLAHEGLLDIIAMGGGPSHSSEDSVVLLTRHGVTGSIPLRTLETHPEQNIPLMPGDRVQVIYLPRTYTVFGATRVMQTPFNTPVLTLDQAIARIGGPADDRADANAIYLFRYESDEVAQKLGLTPKPGGTPIIYNIDLMNPTNYFLSQKFVMKDKDLIFVSNAKVNKLYKFLTLIGAVTSPAITAAYVAR
ncbi:polysaccharide export protein [Gluconacetobacter diazotrophicus PA1 5]|uniref:polysaccharide biosynthesis/export family protein n=1 Tax=Gluconacetobacter diazotrophicus TaxID=33996 RepID=UPI000173AF6C|nr:polysaccharide biosynthesis/export family protein [Gluconacetobacter diazotrophicus]ACI50455.1 polysaccharide export protein [Gluconacetobacter diazotrophicus PA1 5]TWA98315.1 polysaccharide export outer membrane protein [Gluconacetobacter diazotrophicus]